MADFTGVSNRLDPNVKKNEGGTFTVFPEGDYKVVILKDIVTDNKKKIGKLWKIKLQIIEGQFEGKTFDDNINIIHNSTVCQQIGQGILRNICELTDVPYPPTSTDPIMGKPIGCHLTTHDFTSNVSGKILQSNNVSGYFPAEDVNPDILTKETPPDKKEEDVPW